MRDENNNLPELPKGWVCTRLGEICLKPQYGWTTSAATKGALHLLRTTDITSGNIDWSSVPYCKEEPPEKEKYLLKDGDIVISRAGSIGYGCLIKNPRHAVFASYLIRFRPLIEERYLAFFVKSPYYWQSISEKSIGIAIPNVNATKLKQIFLPLPPFPEQHRIVVKIEELFTRLDAGVEALKKVKAELRRYHQAVLKYAFEGKLTEKWRKKIQNAELGVCNESKIQDNSTLRIPHSPLPEGWVWAKVSNIGRAITGTTPSKARKEYYGNDYPFFKPTDLNNGYYVKKSQDGLSKEGIKRARLLPAKSILVTCIGATIGKTGFIRTAGASNQQINAIIPKSGILPEFIYFMCVSPEFRKNIIDSASATTLPILNKGKFKSLFIPLPPLAEQHKIVEEIEGRLSAADETERVVDQSLKQAERLRQSILKKAFEGKLVPQNPTDEPAEKLLEQIKAKKVKLESNKKGKKGPYAK